jgi:hypothetical protein
MRARVVVSSGRGGQRRGRQPQRGRRKDGSRQARERASQAGDMRCSHAECVCLCCPCALCGCPVLRRLRLRAVSQNEQMGRFTAMTRRTRERDMRHDGYNLYSTAAAVKLRKSLWWRTKGGKIAIVAPSQFSSPVVALKAHKQHHSLRPVALHLMGLWLSCYLYPCVCYGRDCDLEVCLPPRCVFGGCCAPCLSSAAAAEGAGHSGTDPTGKNTRLHPYVHIRSEFVSACVQRAQSGARVGCPGIRRSAHVALRS